MKEKDILVSLDMAKDEYIEEASPENEKVKKKIKNRFKWVAPVVSAAACICVVSIGASLLLKGDDIGTTSSHDFPLDDIPLVEYTASDVADIVITDTSDGDTKYYTEEYFHSDKYLEEHIKDNLPLKEEFLPVYEDVRFDRKQGEKGMVLFEKYEGVIDRFCEQAGTSYLKNEENLISEVFNRPYFYLIPGYRVDINSTEEYECVDISHTEWGNGDATDNHLRRYFKNGELTINWSRTDEELIKDTEWLKNDLFEIFGREFTDVAVERDCWYSNNYVDIIFYNKADAHIGYNTVYDDHIKIRFKTNEDIDGEMFLMQVYFVDYSKTVAERQKVMAKAKTITLTEAEELLAKGYVFCEHVCMGCIQEQEAISFDDYDFVELNYIFRYLESPSRPGDIEGLPFYTFYKKIRDTNDGRVLYAVTNVCAIKLTGYEEYFASREKYHS